MVNISWREQEALNKDYQDDNSGLSPLRQTWGITGERKYKYYRDTRYVLVFGLPLGLSFCAWHWFPTGTAHTVSLVMMIVTGTLFGCYSIYRITHGWSTPQLRWSELKDAKRSSQENKAELIQFSEEVQKDNEKHTD